MQSEQQGGEGQAEGKHFSEFFRDLTNLPEDQFPKTKGELWKWLAAYFDRCEMDFEDDYTTFAVRLLEQHGWGILSLEALRRHAWDRRSARLDGLVRAHELIGELVCDLLGGDSKLADRYASARKTLHAFQEIVEQRIALAMKARKMAAAEVA